MTKNEKNLPIVSASKLVSESNAELNEVEYGLIICQQRLRTLDRALYVSQR